MSMSKGCVSGRGEDTCEEEDEEDGGEGGGLLPFPLPPPEEPSPLGVFEL